MFYFKYLEIKTTEYKQLCWTQRMGTAGRVRFKVPGYFYPVSH